MLTNRTTRYRYIGAFGEVELLRGQQRIATPPRCLHDRFMQYVIHCQTTIEKSLPPRLDLARATTGSDPHEALPKKEGMDDPPCSLLLCPWLRVLMPVTVRCHRCLIIGIAGVFAMLAT